MISLVLTFATAALLVRLWRNRRAAFIASFFLLFQFILRVPDVAYLDVTGPVYAAQLAKFIGGSAATPYFVLSWAFLLLPLYFAFNPAYLARAIRGPIPVHPAYDRMRLFGLIVSIAIILIAYLDMLRVGVIPVLSGMDRTEYELIAGPTYSILYNNGFLFTMAMGFLMVLPRLQGGRLDVKFLFLFGALMVFWVLTGNRFSIFYRELCFFALPSAAVVWMIDAGVLGKRRARDVWAAFGSSRLLVPLAMVIISVVIGGLLFNSYYNVRGYADPVFEMTQRIVVQPVEIYLSTFETETLNRFTVNWEAFDFLFSSQIAGTANTSMPYLMSLEIGYFRALELIEAGTQFAGGYPEILLVLVGGWFALPVMLVAGLISVGLLRLSVVSMARGHLMTALASIYVYFGFTLLYIGGMLNFLIAPTFWIKVAFLVLAKLFEERMLSGTRTHHAPPPSARSFARKPTAPTGLR